MGLGRNERDERGAAEDRADKQDLGDGLDHWPPEREFSADESSECRSEEARSQFMMMRGMMMHAVQVLVAAARGTHGTSGRRPDGRDIGLPGGPS